MKIQTQDTYGSHLSDKKQNKTDPFASTEPKQWNRTMNQVIPNEFNFRIESVIIRVTLNFFSLQSLLLTGY